MTPDLTPEQTDRFFALHNAGKDACTIAVFLNAEFGISLNEKTVLYICGTLGLAYPGEDRS